MLEIQLKYSKNHHVIVVTKQYNRTIWHPNLSNPSTIHNFVYVMDFSDKSKCVQKTGSNNRNEIGSEPNLIPRFTSNYCFYCLENCPNFSMFPTFFLNRFVSFRFVVSMHSEYHQS